MRGLVFLFLAAMAMTAVPTAFGEEPVTVDQLKAVLVQEQEREDSVLASRLSGL
jgi:hypothetical protein